MLKPLSHIGEALLKRKYNLRLHVIHDCTWKLCNRLIYFTINYCHLISLRWFHYCRNHWKQWYYKFFSRYQGV